MTFAQSVGMEKLPSQLEPDEVSPQLRAKLWEAFHASVNPNVSDNIVYGDWRIMLYTHFVERLNRPADEFTPVTYETLPRLKDIVFKGKYWEVLDLFEFFLKQPECPEEFRTWVAEVLESCHSAYRVFDGEVIGRISSDEEAAVLTAALAQTSSGRFTGAHTHLKEAVTTLREGEYAESIKHSIHAVESAARVIAPKSSLDAALAEIAKTHKLHGGMQAGFKSLYGFTSSAEGIRHPLLERGAAEVDEADALYMLGSCAAFVSYLIARALK